MIVGGCQIQLASEHLEGERVVADSFLLEASAHAVVPEEGRRLGQNSSQCFLDARRGGIIKMSIPHAWPHFPFDSLIRACAPVLISQICLKSTEASSGAGSTRSRSKLEILRCTDLVKAVLDLYFAVILE